MAVVITLDGPSGSGKGTVARILAERLGFNLLDSGALYRVLGLYASERGVALDDPEAVGELARSLPVSFAVDGDYRTRVLLAGRDVSREIRSEAAGDAASRVAALAPAREALLERQRAFEREPGLVADGRDMGTVVFPAAQVKIYLTASVEERAARRYKQLLESGLPADLEALLSEIAERDRRDMNRAVAPLRPAADAVEVDSTGLGIEEVVQAVLDVAERRLGYRP